MRFAAVGGPAAEPGRGLATVSMMVGSPVAVARAGAVTVSASLVAGLLGPVAIARYAVVLSVPVWIAWYWLVRRG